MGNQVLEESSVFFSTYYYYCCLFLLLRCGAFGLLFFLRKMGGRADGIGVLDRSFLFFFFFGWLAG